MKKAKLQEFKENLLKHKLKILSHGTLRQSDDLVISSDDLPDEADLAANVINQQVTFDLRRREHEKLRAIEMALAKIEDGTYGLCEECDEPISEKRLEKQPWANLCITHAEEQERENSQLYKYGT